MMRFFLFCFLLKPDMYGENLAALPDKPSHGLGVRKITTKIWCEQKSKIATVLGYNLFI